VPIFGYAVVLISGLLLALLSVQQYRERGAGTQLVLQLAGIAAYLAGILYFFGLPGTLVAKGPDQDQRFLAAVAVLYVFVLLGMVAQSFYSWFDKSPAQRRGKFDWGPTIKPILISPIVLIPTVAGFQNANIDLTRLGFPWLMILLTAFEKGFLWRHYLAKTTAEATATGRGRTNG
jgi:hypothetical protein